MNEAQKTPSPEYLRCLKQAMMRLRPAQREVFLMNRVEKLTYGEIADRLGITAKQVERRIAAALCALDRELCRVNRPGVVNGKAPGASVGHP